MATGTLRPLKSSSITTFSRPTSLPAVHTVPYNAIPSKPTINTKASEKHNGYDLPFDPNDLTARLDSYLAIQKRIADRKRLALVRPILPAIPSTGLAAPPVNAATGAPKPSPARNASKSVPSSSNAAKPAVPVSKPASEKPKDEEKPATFIAPSKPQPAANVGKSRKGRPEELQVKRLDVHAKEIARQEARREKKMQHVAAVHAARSKPVPAGELAKKLSAAAGRGVPKSGSAERLNENKGDTLTTLPNTVYRPDRPLKRLDGNEDQKSSSIDSTRRKARPASLIYTGPKRAADGFAMTTTPMTPAFKFSNTLNTPMTPAFNFSYSLNTPLTPAFKLSSTRNTPLTPAFSFPNLNTPATPFCNAEDTVAEEDEGEDREEDERKHDSGATAFKWRKDTQNDSIASSRRRVESMDSTHVQDIDVLKIIEREAYRKGKSSLLHRRNCSDDSSIRGRGSRKRSSMGPDWESWRWPGGRRRDNGSDRVLALRAATQRQDWSQKDEEDSSSGHQFGLMGLYVQVPSMRRSSKNPSAQPVLPTPSLTESSRPSVVSNGSGSSIKPLKGKKNYAVDSLSTMMTEETRRESEDLTALATAAKEKAEAQGELGLALEFEFSADGLGIAVNTPQRSPYAYAFESTLPPVPASPYAYAFESTLSPVPASPFVSDTPLMSPLLKQHLQEHQQKQARELQEQARELQEKAKLLQEQAVQAQQQSLELAQQAVVGGVVGDELLSTEPGPTILEPVGADGAGLPPPSNFVPVFAAHEKKDSLKERRQRSRGAVGSTGMGRIEVFSPSELRLESMAGRRKAEGGREGERDFGEGDEYEGLETLPERRENWDYLSPAEVWSPNRLAFWKRGKRGEVR